MRIEKVTIEDASELLSIYNPMLEIPQLHLNMMCRLWRSLKTESRIYHQNTHI